MKSIKTQLVFRRLILTSILITGLFTKVIAQETSFVDLGECQLKVVKIENLKKIDTDTGVLKPKSGKNKLVAVTIEGRTASAGSFVITPDLYTAVFNYRRTIGMVRSVAIGSKGQSKSTGEYSEVWFNSDDVRLICDTGKDEHLSLYIIFDLPGEVEEFKVQVPKMVQ